jgi:hypothetical protein
MRPIDFLDCALICDALCEAQRSALLGMFLRRIEKSVTRRNFCRRRRLFRKQGESEDRADCDWHRRDKIASGD